MQTLQDLIKDLGQGARAAHAFVVEGRATESRGAFIRQLASGLECSEADASLRPCGRCPSCRQIAAGTSLDIVYMEKSQGSGKTSRASYKVSDAGAFIERLRMGSYGRYLIGIINDADSMSEVIQNKLLKTLEEPGENTILILAAANRDNLLDTVRSRCSDIRMDSIEWEGNPLLDENGTDAGFVDSSSSVSSESPSDAKLYELCDTFRNSKKSFHQFRDAYDKTVKNSDDAIVFLDILENSFRTDMIAVSENMSSPAAYSNVSGYANAIETVNMARMDIRREMNHTKALRRLFLELH